MNSSDYKCNPLPFRVRNQKNAVFNGKKYPIDFDLLTRYSNYFFNNKSEYEKLVDIIFPNEPIEINEEAFLTFLNSCQGKSYILNQNNFFIVRSLAYRYEVPDLIEEILNYICSKQHLRVKSSLYDLIQNKDDQIKREDGEKIIAKSILEDIKIIDNEEMLKLSVPVLDRILYKYELNINNLDESKLNKIIEFLFKYLEKHPINGSALFLKINDLKIETILKLHENYSEIFDFNMINNKSLLKITLDTTNILNQNSTLLKIFKKRTMEINDKIDDFTTKISSKINYFDAFINKIDQFKEKFNQMKGKVYKMDDDIKFKNEYIQNLQNQNEKMSQIISDINAQSILVQNINESHFNNLKGESQIFYLSNIIKQNKCNLLQKVSNLLKFLSNEQEKANYPNNTKNYIYIYPKCNKEILITMKDIDIITINSYVVETLYKNGSLNSNEFIEQLNAFDTIVVEIRYPSNDFENIYNCLTNIQKTQCNSLKIGVHYIEYVNHYYFQKKNKNIYLARIDCETVDGGEGKGIFEENDSLERLIISDKVKNIGDGSFFSCTNLKFILFGKNISNIGISAFDNCTNVEIITLNNENELIIHENAFNSCTYLKQFECNPYKTKLQHNSFNGCNSLKQLKFSSLLNSTYKYDFVNYDKFTEIIIPDLVNKIGSESFKNLSFLEAISIPPSVTLIEDYSFYNCKKLSKIYFGSSLSKIGKFAFSGCSSLKQIIIPQMLKSIGESAFSECTSLNQITFIYPSLLNNIGSGAFEGCSSLIQISIPYSITSINSNTFKNCTSLKTVEIPCTITKIGDSSFENCISISQIEIPFSITEIGSSCFENCTSLIQIVFQNRSSVKSIGQKGFKGCSSLKHFLIPYELATIETSLFQDCSSLIEMNIPNNVKSIKEHAFDGCESITKMSLPITLESIGITSLFKCKSIQCFNAPWDIIDKLYDHSSNLLNGNGIASNNVEAFRYAKISADNGNANAMYRCYEMLNKGNGVDKNKEEENKYLKMAAKKDHAFAMNDYACKLASIIKNKVDNDKNYSKPFKYFERAAANGCIKALFNCGLYYELGRGVAKNYNKAIEYYEMAAKKGDSNSKEKLNVLKGKDTSNN